MNKDFWNQRYDTNDNIYGYTPNEFFKEQLDRLSPGTLLLPAEGEGRNAVYAATTGWDVTAFDFSDIARRKALALAASRNVKIDYTTSDITEYAFDREFDALALIYLHLDPATRIRFHQRCMQSLKTGGYLILEAFSKEQIGNTTGGPKDPALLYDLEEVALDFAPHEIAFKKRLTTYLDEGPFHSGISDIIRIVAKKN